MACPASEREAASDERVAVRAGLCDERRQRVQREALEEMIEASTSLVRQEGRRRRVGRQKDE